MKIIVIGDGAWGTAFASVLNDSGHQVVIMSLFPEYAEKMKHSRVNHNYLPGYIIDPSITIAHLDEFDTFDDFNLIINAVPTQFVRESFIKLKPKIDSQTPIISLSKGLEIKTQKRISIALREILGKNEILILSGPSHAEEVIQRLPVVVTIAGENHKLAEKMRDEISNDYFRVYSNDDTIGVEYCGAIKNVIGIAAGIVDGLEFGDNTKSALITRGLVEVVRLGEKLNAKTTTFYGLSGLGDLITTSISRHGRNWNCGFQIGRGKTLPQILEHSSKVVEGVYTVKAIKTLYEKFKVEMPICKQVYQVLYEGKKPADAVLELMTRSYKFE